MYTKSATAGTETSGWPTERALKLETRHEVKGYQRFRNAITLKCLSTLAHKRRLKTAACQACLSRGADDVVTTVTSWRRETFFLVGESKESKAVAATLC